MSFVRLRRSAISCRPRASATALAWADEVASMSELKGGLLMGLLCRHNHRESSPLGFPSKRGPSTQAPLRPDPPWPGPSHDIVLRDVLRDVLRAGEGSSMQPPASHSCARYFMGYFECAHGIGCPRPTAPLTSCLLVRELSLLRARREHATSALLPAAAAQSTPPTTYIHPRTIGSIGRATHRSQPTHRSHGAHGAQNTVMGMWRR